MEQNTFNTQETESQIQPSAPAQDSAPSSVENKPAEKMLPQSEVNKIVAATKKQMQERYEGVKPQTQQQVTHESPEDAARRVFAEELKKAQEITQQKRVEAEHTAKWNTIVTSLASKIENGAKKYEDWDTVTSGVDFSAIPQVLEAANDVENSADVLYELSANPAKLGAILPLLQNQNPAMQALGKRELQKLSLSLKNNEIAANRVPIKKPLTPIKPSSVTNDNGKATWAELRSKYISKV